MWGYGGVEMWTCGEMEVCWMREDGDVYKGSVGMREDRGVYKGSGG